MHPFISECPFITELVPGMTIVYDDPGVYGTRAPSDLPGKILEVRKGRYVPYLVVETPGYNLPRVIRADQVVAFALTSLVNEETAEVAVTSEPSAA